MNTINIVISTYTYSHTVSVTFLFGLVLRDVSMVRISSKDINIFIVWALPLVRNSKQIPYLNIQNNNSMQKKKSVRNFRTGHMLLLSLHDRSHFSLYIFPLKLFGTPCHSKSPRNYIYSYLLKNSKL